MRLTVRTFAVVALFCAFTYEASQAAPIAPIGGMRTGSSNITRAYLHHRQGYSYYYWHRRYGYRPYWWPPGRYHWFPYGPERWDYSWHK